jgi:hypothetical protein
VRYLHQRAASAGASALYAGAGWAGYGDWLKTGAVATHLRQYKSFKEARAYVRRLGLKSEAQWRAYCKSGKKPDDIPAHADRTYADAGWAGMSDWLGNEFQPFKKARAYVRRLGLKSSTEWSTYCKSSKKPQDIPASPQPIYADAGWAGMSDWLGTGTIAPHLREYRSFKKARAFARSLNLKSETEWRAYTRSSRKPDDIPARPSRTYAKDGWAGMSDWLGTGAPPFKKARAFARSLNLKSATEWRTYTQSGKKPDNVPTNPNRTYAVDGWAGMGDWLGYVRSGR